MTENLESVFSGILQFWDKLTEGEKELLISSTAQASYVKGENIHGGVNDCAGVVIVKSGVLRTYMLSDDGKELTLYRLYAGDMCVLSASCVLSCITFDIFVDAESDCEIYLVSAPVFSEITQNNIYAECFAYKMAAIRFSDVMWAMQQILFMSFDRRLAVFIIDELSKSGGNTLKMTHDQIAKYMGSAREVVSRMLKYFTNEGIVELSRGEITVTDRKKLMKLI